MAMTDLTRGAYSGQFGFLIVEPKSEPGRYDQEIFLAGRHWDPFILHRGEPNNDWTVDYKLCTLADKALGYGEPIRVRQGQRVLFHFLNADATRQLTLALPGHRFQVIALDGNPVPTPATVDYLQLAVAERVDAIVEMNQPGVWVLGSARDQDRAIGMGVVVEYADRKGEPQWKCARQPTWDYGVFGAPLGTQAKPPEPDGTFDLTFKMLADEGKPFNRWTVNDKFWPAIDPLIVHRGRRYRLTFHNGMEDSHPIHLHRHSFELVSIAGKPTAGIMKDTVNIPRNTAIEVDVVADNPGPSLLHCHMQQHMDFGFKTTAEVRLAYVTEPRLCFAGSALRPSRPAHDSRFRLRGDSFSRPRNRSQHRDLQPDRRGDPEISAGAPSRGIAPGDDGHAELRRLHQPYLGASPGSPGRILRNLRLWPLGLQSRLGGRSAFGEWQSMCRGNISTRWAYAPYSAER